MLGTLACVGGCAFNYHSRGARGIEMIPCIGVLRNAWTSVVGRVSSHTVSLFTRLIICKCNNIIFVTLSICLSTCVLTLFDQ